MSHRADTRHVQSVRPEPAQLSVLAVVTTAAVVAVMPVFLVGASAVFLRRSLRLDEAALGMAIAFFFAASAVSSVVGGHLAERIGARRALVSVCVTSSLVMLGIAAVVGNLSSLSMLLGAGGCLNGIAQPATNLALAQSEVNRPALMFGVKQSAIPLATMLAGASVPIVSVTIGWRWAFGVGALLALTVAMLAGRVLPPSFVRKQSIRSGSGNAAKAPLLALSVATGVGTAAAVSLGSFLVEAAVVRGIAVGSAGWLLVAGSVAGVFARVFAGWLADRMQGRALQVVSAMLILGAGGYTMLAVGGPAVFSLGALLAYACGWGWTGLLNFAVVRLNPGAPAVASGIVLTGAAGGAALGPLLFGYAVRVSSFGVAWSMSGVVAFLSAMLVLASRRWLIHDRARREARHGYASDSHDTSAS